MKTKTQSFSPDLLDQMDAYWRAANYNCCASIFRP
jgi:phosphoketolase